MATCLTDENATVHMSNLLLDTINIRGFRGFQELQVERFGRVNLLVGRNNSGKSSLLEALRLYAQRGSPRVIWDILAARDEMSSRASRMSDDGDLERVIFACEQLFFGRAASEIVSHRFSLGPIATPRRQLTVAMQWLGLQETEDGQQLRILQDESPRGMTRVRPAFVIDFDGNIEVIPLDQDLRFLRTRARPDSEAVRQIRAVNVPANGLDNGQVGRLWDTIALTNLEDDVVDALRIIAPSVERISLIGDRPHERSVVVKLPGFGRPIPLRSMGDGMSRMLGIALSLVSARDGVLLLDEIENGIHYSVQPELWRLVFRTAQRLNVQVFASTHSWDCISAFQSAAQDDPYEEATLVRLEQSADGVRSITFGERELAVVARKHIEVR